MNYPGKRVAVGIGVSGCAPAYRLVALLHRRNPNRSSLRPPQWGRNDVIQIQQAVEDEEDGMQRNQQHHHARDTPRRGWLPRGGLLQRLPGALSLNL